MSRLKQYIFTLTSVPVTLLEAFKDWELSQCCFNQMRCTLWLQTKQPLRLTLMKYQCYLLPQHSTISKMQLAGSWPFLHPRECVGAGILVTILWQWEIRHQNQIWSDWRLWWVVSWLRRFLLDFNNHQCLNLTFWQQKASATSDKITAPEDKPVLLHRGSHFIKRLLVIWTEVMLVTWC